MKGGVRQFAYIKPDRFLEIQNTIGVLASEEFMAQLAELLRSQLTAKDLCGRFGGNGILVMLERGTARDVETWAENIVKRVNEHTFVFEVKNLPPPSPSAWDCCHPANPDIDAAITDAVNAVRRGRELGGNQMYAVDKADTDTRVQAYDKIWVKHIKSALMENRFRLVQQPIASLLGEDKGMFDVLVRMLDEQGNEVLPAEFIAAAERNDLMKNIDRWVIGASMSFAANRKASCIFVRVSKDTILDKSLIGWLDTQFKSLKIEPKRLCIQVTEEVATQYVRQTKELADSLRKLGFRFALEHFGTGRDPLKLLTDIGMNFIKIDGSLMQGLVDQPAAAAAREGFGRSRQAQRRGDDRRARGRRQYHGRALAARHRIHPGLLRERARRRDDVGRTLGQSAGRCDLEPIDLFVGPGESLPALALLVLELFELLESELHRRVVAAVTRSGSRRVRLPPWPTGTRRGRRISCPESR